MKLRFKEYIKDEHNQSKKLSEGFLKELMKAFKSGYDEENERIKIDNQIKNELKNLEKAEKKKHCKNAEEKLSKYRRSIYRNSESTRKKIKELENAIQYCTKIGEIKAFINKNWSEGEELADTFWDQVGDVYKELS